MTTENTTTTELSITVDFTETEKALQAAEQRHLNVVHDVKTKAGMKAAKADVSELRGMRTTVEARRLEVGRVILAKKKTIDDQAKAIIDRVVKLEGPLKDQIEAYEAEQARLAAEAAQREQDRINGHRAIIQGWRDLPSTLISRPSAGIEAKLADLISEGGDFERFEEFEEEAADAHQAAVSRLADLIQSAQAREAEAERVRQQEAELQAMRDRNAQLEREAEERRRADEQRAHDERVAAEQAETIRVNNIRQKIAYIGGFLLHAGLMDVAGLQERLDEVEELNPDVIPFDFQEFHAEALATWEATVEGLNALLESATQIEREKAEKAAREAVERERLERQAEEDRQRAAQAEQARAQAAQEAEDARQASLTLRTAAQALVDHCVNLGMGHDQPVMDLMAVLMGSDGDVVPRKRQAAKATKVAR